jgi:hypothetical protein
VKRAFIATVAFACHGGGERAPKQAIPPNIIVSTSAAVVARAEGPGDLVRRPYTAYRVSQPVEIDGVPCGIPKIDLWPSGKLRACGMGAARTVLGVPLASGYVMISPDGKLVEAGTLAEDHPFGPFVARKGTPFHFNADGSFGGGTAVAPVKLDGVACAAGVIALEKGALSSCYLDGDQTIDGIPLKGGTELFRYPSGKLRIGTLAAPYGGLAAGEPITLDEGGNIIGGK